MVLRRQPGPRGGAVGVRRAARGGRPVLGRALPRACVGARRSAVDRARRGRHRARAVHGRRADVDRADPRPDRRGARAGMGDARGVAAARRDRRAAARGRVGEPGPARGPARDGRARRRVGGDGRAAAGRRGAALAPEGGDLRDGGGRRVPRLHEPAAARERRARHRRARARAAPAAVGVLRRRGTRVRRLLRGRSRRRHPRRAARASGPRGGRRPRRVAGLGPALPRLRRAAGDRPAGAWCCWPASCCGAGTRAAVAVGQPVARPEQPVAQRGVSRTRCGERPGAAARARGARRRPRTSPG